MSVFCLMMVFLTGCGSLAKLTLKPRHKLTLYSMDHEKTMLQGAFKTGLYQFHDSNWITVLLLDGPVGKPRQVLVIKMFWQPRGSKTPITPNATNATIRHLIFASGENGPVVGIYAGGGYFYPKTKLGSQTLKGEIWDATLMLQHATQGFDDRLGRVRVEGQFNARRDDAAVRSLLRSINRRVRHDLGYPVLVRAGLGRSMVNLSGINISGWHVPWGGYSRGCAPGGNSFEVITGKPF